MFGGEQTVAQVYELVQIVVLRVNRRLDVDLQFKVALVLNRLDTGVRTTTKVRIVKTLVQIREWVCIRVAVGQLVEYDRQCVRARVDASIQLVIIELSQWHPAITDQRLDTVVVFLVRVLIVAADMIEGEQQMIARRRVDERRQFYFDFIIKLWGLVVIQNIQEEFFAQFT